MAKARTINEILADLSKNYKSVLREAVEKATTTAVKDIYAFSTSCIDQYYANYPPSSYDRSDSLWRTIIPYSEVVDRGDSIVSIVGVEYNPSVLDDAPYYSGSEKYGAQRDENGMIVQYGRPDSSWVLENYLLGIHPATNGSRDPATVEYIPTQDPRSTDELTKRYLRMYQHKLNDNVYSYLVRYSMT